MPLHSHSPDVSLVTPYPLTRYLEVSPLIDWSHPSIRELAAAIAARASNESDLIRTSFEWVRDRVCHSMDIQGHRVTARASEVVAVREGICYAKSHLLAALLRAQNVPAGICYQRLTLLDDPADGYVVHALNTVWLNSLGRWIRLDARGNRPGIDAQFSVDSERLAFAVRSHLGEIDYLVNLPAPHPDIVRTLTSYADAVAMCRRLPTALA
jgi:transglutaminase-like putative cysteine protease